MASATSTPKRGGYFVRNLPTGSPELLSLLAQIPAQHWGWMDIEGWIPQMTQDPGLVDDFIGLARFVETLMEALPESIESWTFFREQSQVSIRYPRQEFLEELKEFRPSMHHGVRTLYDRVVARIQERRMEAQRRGLVA